MRRNAQGIFRPRARVAEVCVTTYRARASLSRHRAPECAGIRPNAPQMGTIWAHPKVRRRPKSPGGDPHPDVPCGLPVGRAEKRRRTALRLPFRFTAKRSDEPRLEPVFEQVAFSAYLSTAWA